MKRLIEKITPAIMNFRKMAVQLQDGNTLLVHPHIVVRKKKGEEILKTMVDEGDCLDIPLCKIAGVRIQPESFAINVQCLNFDYQEYELVFPKQEDLFAQ